MKLSAGGVILVSCILFTMSAQARPLSWTGSRADAVAAAQASGKFILLVAGRNTCPNTQFMRYDMCERTGIESVINERYICWYCNIDFSSEHRVYTSGLGGYTLPLICVIDPADPTHYLDRTTNRQTSESAFRARLLSHVPGAFAYEPDNTPGAARKISNGQTQNRALLPEGDVDWAKFGVNGYGAANVRISTTGTDGDTQLYVWRASDGAQIAFNEDIEGSPFARVTIPYLAPGIYQIEVRGYNNVPSPAYALKAAWYPGDAYERDNVSGAAKEIANGETQARNIHAAGNKDWAKFTIGSGGASIVRLETAGTRGDTQMWLYRQNAAGTGAGTLIAYNDNGGVGNFSRIRAAALPAGTYYVKITENGNDGKIAAYTLRAAWGVRADAYEPDNTEAAAGTIANGRTQTRSIHVIGDTDWAKFTVGASGVRNVRISTAPNTTLDLYRVGPGGWGSSLVRIAGDWSHGTGAPYVPRVTLASLPAGTYYIRVAEHGNEATIGVYPLRATWTSP